MLPRYTTPTRTSALGEFVLGAVIAVCIVCAVALAQNADEKADAELERIALAERVRLAQGAKAEHQTIMAAYEAGLTDAMASMRNTPQGVELVQACMALKQIDRGAN